MKAGDIRQLTVEEMQRKVGDLTQELFNLRFQHGVGQLENPSRIRKTKKELARCLTLIREAAVNPQKTEA
ncbi:MAG: 50S ribosomal protein L29 [Desulfobacterales bacterium]|jgi:large subunit ribosomal protein L29|nr:50S ribosomal protein L29 [Desulfobacterales bacterium]